MREIKFNKDQFEKLKPLDLVECICHHCDSTFLKQKRHISYALTKSKWNECLYCDMECYYNSKNTQIKVECLECKKIVIRRKKETEKNIFCSQSCSATYNNKNKKTGNRRSKLEVWIEEKLKNKYDTQRKTKDSGSGHRNDGCCWTFHFCHCYKSESASIHKPCGYSCSDDDAYLHDAGDRDNDVGV